MRRVFLAGLIAFFAVTSSLAAFEVRGLYSATIEVADKGAAERQRAVRAALDQIIAKITGTRSNATADAVVQLRTDADQLVTSERYRRIPFQSDGDGVSPLQPGYELTLRFDHDRIDAALNASGIAKWPAQRPVVALWIGVRGLKGIYLIQRKGIDFDGSRAKLDRLARDKGLPVVLPVTSDIIQLALNFARISAGDTGGLLRSSKRWGANAVLAARLGESADGRWTVKWSLQHGTVKLRWEGEHRSLATALDSGLDHAVGVLVAAAVEGDSITLPGVAGN